MKRDTFLRLALAAVFAAGLTGLSGGAAVAQDCERGTLDARYCDTDGDLIADTPSGEALATNRRGARSARARRL